jgi:hypothetical protein
MSLLQKSLIGFALYGASFYFLYPNWEVVGGIFFALWAHKLED